VKDKYNVLEDGNVEVINYDNEGNVSIQKYEYNDNINEILSIENIIEYLENEAKEYKKQISLKNHIMNSGFEDFLFAIFCAFSVVSGVVCSASVISGIIIGIVGFIICVPSYIYSYIQSIKDEKEIISKESLLKEIDELISKYNKKLTKLKENKNKVHCEVDKNKSFKIIYLEQLKRLKEKLNIYYNVSYNYKKMIKSYKKGKLDDKLRDHYSQEDISLITNYLEEKGPVLSKRYNKESENIK